MQRIAIIGAGGFAREVEWLIRDLNQVSPQFEFAGYLISDLSRLRETDCTEKLLGDFNWSMAPTRLMLWSSVSLLLA